MRGVAEKRSLRLRFSPHPSLSRGERGKERSSAENTSEAVGLFAGGDAADYRQGVEVDGRDDVGVGRGDPGALAVGGDQEAHGHRALAEAGREEAVRAAGDSLAVDRDALNLLSRGRIENGDVAREVGILRATRRVFGSTTKSSFSPSAVTRSRPSESAFNPCGRAPSGSSIVAIAAPRPMSISVSVRPASSRVP